VTPPIFGIVGWKNSGKTTLIAKLIRHFSGQGLKAAAVKHAHHAFDIDHEGKDSFLYREAGASAVAISSAKRFAVIKELQGSPEPSLLDLVALVSPADLILVEGFKGERHPKLEVRRLSARDRQPLAPDDNTIISIAADHAADATGTPVFSLDDIAKIADFVLANAKRPPFDIL
jgi:molybdopterin-guanine dinucleotide biosynthesis protein B